MNEQARSGSAAADTTIQPWCAKPGAALAPPAPPCVMVIFGAGGDLTKRLLMPALYNLACWELLPERFALIGVDHSDRTPETLRRSLTETMESFTKNPSGEFAASRINEAVWNRLMARLDYLQGDFEDPETYRKLGERLRETAEREGIGGSALFYLAVAPRFFGPVIEQLGKAGLTRENGAWRRVIVEKPFGRDLASARALNRDILGVLSEDQVYRIDHFLGKETVQNIMAFRFANGLFEPVWNRDHIDHVQITVSETVGVELRGKFYETTGALRDMVPNHLFQLFTLTAMEPPVSFSADAVRDRKEDVLMAVRPLSPEEALGTSVRGQYQAGEIDGRAVPGYRQEPNVDPHSATETFVAMQLMIDNWRWAGVPFYLRTGKRMAQRDSEIAICFKQAPLALFRKQPTDKPAANWLVLQIAPDEGISLEFEAKVPGPNVRLGTVRMNFLYKDYFQVAPSTGYETLIYDCMIGDPTLFQRADNIEAGWRVVQPILDAWQRDAESIAFYPAGSAGPKAADELLARDGRAWRPIG